MLRAILVSRALLVASVLVCASCAGSLDDIDRFAPPPPDAGAQMSPDGGSADDAGMDAGEPNDAGTVDAGEMDAGTEDAGTDGGTRDAGTPDAGTCNALATILTPTCATTFCHSSGSAQAGLDLQSAGLPGRLIGKSSSEEGASVQIINRASPASSALYTKTFAPPPYGSRMPLGGTALTAAQQACLLNWIEAAVAP